MALVDVHLELRVFEDAYQVRQLNLELIRVLHLQLGFKGHLDGFYFDPVLALDVQFIEAAGYAMPQVVVEGLLHRRFDA